MTAATTPGVNMIDRIARAVMYEGYALYPYRESIKSARRWMWGVLYPRAFVEAACAADVSTMGFGCLARAVSTEPAEFDLDVRFLRLVARTVRRLPAGSGPGFDWDRAPLTALEPVPSLDAGGRLHLPWRGGEEQLLRVERLGVGVVRQQSFSLPARAWREALRDAQGAVVGVQAYEVAGLEVVVTAGAAAVLPGVIRLDVEVANHTLADSLATTDRDAAQSVSPLSLHAIATAHNAEFCSMTDPPAWCAAHAAQCRQLGLWPVLVGEPERASAMLAAPFVLGDYPAIAPESFGDMFDGTEIDEILTLRIRTLTDEEKTQAAALDPRLAALIARADGRSGADIDSLHGALRSPSGEPLVPRIGERVVLRPRGRADVMDLALTGRCATVVAVQEDYEGRTHVSVVVEDDPGAHLGAQGKPGHRFFFGLNEIELLPAPHGIDP